MICNNCTNEFTNIDGLKFCPYCGEELEGPMNSNVESKDSKGEKIVTGEENKKKHEDTLPMPTITEEHLKKYKRDKFFSSLKKPNIKLKVIIPIIALLFVITGGVFAYNILIVKPVDEVTIKENLVGKIITLPKGTSIKISKDNMKSFSIKNRNTDKNKDDINLALTLNNGSIEVNILGSVVYTYQGKKQWKISDGIILDKVITLKPVVGMAENKFLEALKKLSISIADTKITLGGKDVKGLAITLRTPELENGKEEIQVQISIDSGLMATTGKIKCRLVFENEAWSIATTEKNSTEDFILVISPTFSDEILIEPIRKQGLEGIVTYSDFFQGIGYNVADRFTKSINIAGKKIDVQKGVLYVTAKRENIAGEITSVLSTGYTFSISLSKIALTDTAKTTVTSGTINNMPTSLIISTITNMEIEGSNPFFWFSNNHKITSQEAKTFKTSEILSKKGLDNVKYVYGSITYKDDKKNKDVSISFVALYFLVYDGTNGYTWKLDKIIGEESPNYKQIKNQ